MITRLLVANRGEIARRVIRTCRDLGVSPVAVFSDADADAPHVGEADLAVRLPGAAPSETYLRADLLVAAARTAGADAVHPGYGFLSENADFARAVLDAGLTWVGPPPEAIAAMGSKVAAKAMMAEAGVPVLPELDPAEVTEADLPVLVKASAGGGGRGMRVVRSLSALPTAVADAEAEAASAFGDGTVFCEPYLERGRHIEVQVLADRHGAVWAFPERECSLQRRHQKVLEETPSPAVDEELREALRAAATAAVTAIGYVGAGTVEFLLAPDGRFFFLETNTRLQVEHPITECVTGSDLVRWQLAIAEGARLPEGPPPARGHAIEVRLYAEDPADGWRPSTGVLHRFALASGGPGTGSSTMDGQVVEFRTGERDHGLRLDSGVAGSSVIGTHYDPMLAKVIAWAPTRTEAARRLASALASARVHGPTTNRDLLVRALRHPAFLAGDTDTAFLATHDLTAPLADRRAREVSALAAALADAADARRRSPVQRGVPPGWRNLSSQPERKRFLAAGEEIEIAYRLTRDGVTAEGFPEVALVGYDAERVVLDVDGVRVAFDVGAYGDEVYVDSALGPVALRQVPRFTEPGEAVEEGSLLAPMPGTVVAVEAAEGDEVRAGQDLVVLEAMKMRHAVRAPADGVLRALKVAAGDQVEAGAVLAVVH
ncbi:propionyl-CoA carboxylase alpha chain [Streptoalloteichus tenebrarius]|uniref:Propionyl-CoA carboxylase alpha chain n=1 Tax=Streptoalloteichus tenebrarius (strain ATCC 17920 / DSM 40477 / JCM 4838 / CBS 697.72 / NBRC 16177 / NCIMB 11028 / NRRL B-12390 / A12253. 1 / ISP 5477) TaxID=1933 RepID=A0ABT1HXS4_STRSD|nr:biotin carboxylase N-terminal domain-containing protein [Streptoalloteichus tenebrarius]MCP2260328.1 propionyl-CoA carboxylase alpha chain [Streptoalloteichus tenebrarius]BFF03078.1 biotin carboxylase N-terminal domain-containing protein [Streptoalloteichus tenebrarius]